MSRLYPSFVTLDDGSHGWSLPQLQAGTRCAHCHKELNFKEKNYFCIAYQLLFCRTCAAVEKTFFPCEEEATFRKKDHLHYCIARWSNGSPQELPLSSFFLFAAVLVAIPSHH